jgi:hypothetical protein
VKNILPYVLMLVGTLVSAVLLMVLLMITRPELFGGGTPGSTGLMSPPAATGNATRAKAAPPGENASTSPPPAASDSLAPVRQNPAGVQDGLAKAACPEAEGAPRIAPPDTVTPLQAGPTFADSARTSERRAMAKVFDTMQAENAARILSELPDSEVKEILLAVKKRQAAKILAALDPGRAARILR